MANMDIKNPIALLIIVIIGSLASLLIMPALVVCLLWWGFGVEVVSWWGVIVPVMVISIVRALFQYTNSKEK